MESIKKLFCCSWRAKRTKKRHSDFFKREKKWFERRSQNRVCGNKRVTKSKRPASLSFGDAYFALPFDDLESLCSSSHGVEDESDDEVAGEPDGVSVSTRARYTYGLDRFEKNAMIIFAQSDEREDHVSERIDMLKSRFGAFRFEAEVHVDKSVEEMNSALEQFFSKDFSGVGAVALVVLARSGEAGLLAARAQRCHESTMIRWLTDHQPDALKGKPKIYITEAHRTGATADTGCYSLPLNKYRDHDVLAIHIPVLINGESHPLKILCEQLGSDDFLDDVYTAVHSAETTFSELKDRPIQVISTLQMQLRLEKAS